MKYIITLWLCASAIFTQAQRPTPATTGDLVLMKSHIYDMVNGFFGKMQKKIDSLEKRLATAELQIALLGGTKIQGSGRPWDHSWGPSDTLYHMGLDAATLILPVDTSGHPITIDSLMKWLHGRGDRSIPNIPRLTVDTLPWPKWITDPSYPEPVFTMNWDWIFRPGYRWNFAQLGLLGASHTGTGILDSAGYLTFNEPIYAPNRLPGEHDSWSDYAIGYGDDNQSADPRPILAEENDTTGGTFKLRYSVDQRINCIDGIWHLTTEVNDSRLGKRYSHTIKSTLKWIKMLKKAEYDAAFDALAEINVSDRQTEHTAP